MSFSQPLLLRRINLSRRTCWILYVLLGNWVFLLIGRLLVLKYNLESSSLIIHTKRYFALVLITPLPRISLPVTLLSLPLPFLSPLPLPILLLPFLPSRSFKSTITKKWENLYSIICLVSQVGAPPFLPRKEGTVSMYLE